MTTPAKAKRVVVFATAGTVIVASVASIRKDGQLPSPTIPLGGFIAGITLAVVAEFAPTIAAAFAGVTFTTAIFVTGGDFIDTITDLTGGKAPPKPTGTNIAGAVGEQLNRNP